MRRQPQKLLIPILVLALLGLCQTFSIADTFDLSYSLIEGGLRLELNPANPYRGVSLSVTSDVATRYEIVQRVIKPLENRDDPSQVIRDNFVYRGLSGTNHFGTLRVPTNDTQVRSEEILYVSNPVGAQDSFTLVYGIQRIEDVLPGQYYGRISYTLTPIGSSRQPVTKILEVYVNVSREQAARPTIEISTARGGKTIQLSSRQEEFKQADVQVKINGNFRRLFTINQVITSPLESNEGNQLPYEAINFVVRDVDKGLAINQPTPLSAGVREIYSSSPSGDADSDFTVNYSLGDLSGEKAGRYRTNIQYYLEEAGVQQRIETLTLEVENEKVFDLLVTPQDQRYSIVFSGLKVNEPPKINEVVIEIKTNMGKQYQVSQNLYSELTTAEGNSIPSRYFTLRTESVSTKGTLKFPENQEVKKGESVLFVSDANGSSDKFKVVYELVSPPDILAGDYSSRISYTITEL
ncbi:MAG: hypothetical protein AB1481_04905 [Candidatus Omnitrophota bacterium]